MVSDESDSTSRAINESARRSGSPEGVQEDRLEKEMICRAEFGERIVLVGHNPEPVVFATTREHIDHVEPDDRGHYSREAMDRLVSDGHAERYEGQMLMDVLHALPTLVGGCPPVG